MAEEFVTITMSYQGKTVQAQVTDAVAQDEDCIGRFVTARMTPELMRTNIESLYDADNVLVL